MQSRINRYFHRCNLVLRKYSTSQVYDVYTVAARSAFVFCRAISNCLFNRCLYDFLPFRVYGCRICAIDARNLYFATQGLQTCLWWRLAPWSENISMAQGLVQRCVLCIFWCVLLQLWEDHVAMEGMCGPSRPDCAHAVVDSCLAAIATLAWEVFTAVRYTCVRRLEM